MIRRFSPHDDVLPLMLPLAIIITIPLADDIFADAITPLMLALSFCHITLPLAIADYRC